MLRTYLRMAPVLVRGRLAPRTNVSEVARRVALHQVDLNRHMNQACYASELEVGRAHWMVRSGGWARWRAVGANPVVANQRIEYRRELRPFQRFVVHTRALGVEGRLLHLQGHLLVDDRVHAVGDVRVLFIGPDGVLAPDAVPPLVDGLLAPPLAVDAWRVTA